MQSLREDHRALVFRVNLLQVFLYETRRQQGAINLVSFPGDHHAQIVKNRAQYDYDLSILVFHAVIPHDAWHDLVFDQYSENLQRHISYYFHVCRPVISKTHPVNGHHVRTFPERLQLHVLFDAVHNMLQLDIIPHRYVENV